LMQRYVAPEFLIKIRPDENSVNPRRSKVHRTRSSASHLFRSVRLRERRCLDN
jgi:hypothetical protein